MLQVIVIGHVPPGVFEKHQDHNWFYPQYNEKFLAILRAHADIIGAMHFGHHHTDTFRVLYSEEGNNIADYSYMYFAFY